MANEQQTTSFNNQEYNLLSTIYHSLQSSQTYATYANDAHAVGDQDLANFFVQLQRQHDNTPRWHGNFWPGR